MDDPLRRFVVANDPAMSERLQAIVPVLEIFNGLGVAQAGTQAPVFSTIAAPDGSPQQVTTYTLFAEQVQPMLNAYEQLRQSVYGALVMQTRLKPYLDAVELVIEDEGGGFGLMAKRMRAIGLNDVYALERDQADCKLMPPSWVPVCILIGLNRKSHVAKIHQNFSIRFTAVNCRHLSFSVWQCFALFSILSV